MVDSQTQNVNAEEIIARLNVAAEYEALGVRVAGRPAAADGWLPCHAIGRDDRNPSAAINVQTGRYKDHGGDGENLSLWDAAVKAGRFADWTEARQHYADKAGVELPRVAMGNGSHRAAGPARPAAKPAAKPEAKPVAIYPTSADALAVYVRQFGKPSTWFEYPDASGRCVAFIYRWNLPSGDKIIRPVSRNGSGWSCCQLPEPRPLYRLPTLTAAEVVFVSEGEKAADATIDAGLVGTTSPHGAKSPKKADWAPLAGKRVVLLPDNDTEGERYAADVAGLLAKLNPVPRVKIVRLPDLPPKGDAFDYIQRRLSEGASRDEIRSEIWNMANAAELVDLQAAGNQSADGKNDAPPSPIEYRAVAVETCVRAADRQNFGYVVEDLGDRCLVRFKGPDGNQKEVELPKTELRLQDGTPLATGGDSGTDFPPILTFREMSERYPELQPEVIHGVARRGEVVNVTSTTKAGKSMLTGDLGHASAAAGRWLNSFDVERGPVLILDNELDPRTLRYRIQSIGDARGIPVETYQDTLQTVSFRGRVTDIFQLAPFFDRLEPGRFSIIILDALYRFLGDGVDENSNSDMSRVYNQLVAYATRLECSLVVIHHASKGSQSGKAATDVGSGAGAQSRAADTHLILRPHAEDGAVVLEAVCRSFPPVEPRVLRWRWPVWELATDLDPTLKPERNQRAANRDADVAEMYERILQAFINRPDGATKTEIRNRVGQGKAFDAAWFKATNGGDLVEAGKVTKGNGQKYDCWKRIFRDNETKDF